MNKIPGLTGAGLLAMLSMTAGPTAAMDVKTGLWESHIESEIEGLPVSPPPMTHRNCVTEEDLVPQMESPGQECKVLEHKVSGETVNWRVQCQQDGMTMTGVGRIRYSGDRYEGDVVMTMDGGSMGLMKMTQTMTGHRIGDCP